MKYYLILIIFLFSCGEAPNDKEDEATGCTDSSAINYDSEAINDWNENMPRDAKFEHGFISCEDSNTSPVLDSIFNKSVDGTITSNFEMEWPHCVECHNLEYDWNNYNNMLSHAIIKLEIIIFNINSTV